MFVATAETMIATTPKRAMNATTATSCTQYPGTARVLPARLVERLGRRTTSDFPIPCFRADGCKVDNRTPTKCWAGEYLLPSAGAGMSTYHLPASDDRCAGW
jgi:hypothetical protein